jgi:protein-S-isoprenylcysteine O-methyltransferase Ste14
MKNILKIILKIFEYLSLFFVGYYGIKYCFVAGPIYFGNPLGTIIAGVVVALFIFHVIKKEGVIKL